MRHSKSDVVLLGPHAGHGSYSIANYFNFTAGNIGPFVPDLKLRALAPGGAERLAELTLPQMHRAKLALEYYTYWPLQLAVTKASLFHVADQGLAWYGRFLRHGRVLVTVHDIINVLIWRKRVPFGSLPRYRLPILLENVRFIKRADHLLCDSTFTADCVMQELGIPGHRITVVFNAVDASFYAADPSERRVIREKWFGDSRFVVIHVGQATSYKNRIGALRAFALVHRSLPEARMFLIHGQPDPEEARFLQECDCEGSIRFLPAVSKPELREFYAAADVLLFPSRYEGFGWPPLEAMACDCAVVGSRAASLPEVIGDGGLLLTDPDDHQGLARSVLEVLVNPQVHQQLCLLGRRNVKRFAPSDILSQIAAVYRHVL